MNIDNEIKVKAELYAEQFRLKSETGGWFQQKVDDFTVGYNSAIKTIRKKEDKIRLLIEDYERRLVTINKTITESRTNCPDDTNYNRLKTKKSEYSIIVVELNRIIN